MDTRIVAEIGCNHKGDINIAKEMVRVAKEFCGVDVVKFQKRNNRELLGNTGYDAPHPNPVHSYGSTYGEHRDFLEFDMEQHGELKRYCEALGVIYSSSVWDLTSAKEMVAINPKLIKVPSAQNTNVELLNYLCQHYEGEIHVSTGMTTKQEIEKIVDIFSHNSRSRALVLYACTSAYPVPFEDACLLEIQTLIDKYRDKVNAIGFSGHHLGVAVDVAATVLGATWIERHFTLDRTWKGTDHAASLEPAGLRKLVRDIDAVERALTFKRSELLDIELVQRQKLKYRRAHE